MTRATADRVAVARYPGLRRLISLRDERGWRFMLRRHHGTLDLLVGYHVWPNGWSDAMAIAAEDDARAYRCDAAGGEVWGREGSLSDVLDGLFELPAPDQPLAPRLVRGAAHRLWVPDVSRWTRRPPA